MSLQAAKRVFATLGDSDMDPRAVAERLGLMQVGDAEEVGRWIDDVLTAYDEAVERYRGGDSKLFGFFMGEVMKASRGKADPKMAQRLLRQRLG